MSRCKKTTAVGTDRNRGSRLATTPPRTKMIFAPTVAPIRVATSTIQHGRMNTTSRISRTTEDERANGIAIIHLRPAPVAIGVGNPCAGPVHMFAWTLGPRIVRYAKRPLLEPFMWTMNRHWRGFPSTLNTKVSSFLDPHIQNVIASSSFALTGSTRSAGDLSLCYHLSRGTSIPTIVGRAGGRESGRRSLLSPTGFALA